jgi:hypothetical protein
VTVTATGTGASGSGNCTAQVTITKGVNVTISPTYENGPNGAVLTYTVTVTNTGNVSNTYNLTATNTAGWSENVSPPSLIIPPWENRTTTLSVTVPPNAIGGTIDNVTVTATGTGASGSGNCTAQVTITKGVNVTISPTYENGPNGAVLTYTVTVTNTGNVSNTYNLTATNTAGWSENVSPASLTIPAFSNGNATLSVKVPSNAIGGTIDNVTVTATGTGASGLGNCTAQVTINRGVNVLISPSYQGGLNGAVLAYTVTVANLGNITDIYDLKLSDNTGWDNIWVGDNTLRVDGFDNENTTTLYVYVPDNAKPCTRDNVIVTAISQMDNTVKTSGNCVAHAEILRVVNVLISPPSDNGLVKDVTITNMGNVVDSYNLAAGDNVGWRLMLAENQFVNLMPGENRVTTLDIAIPAYTKSGTVGGITATATSVDNTVNGNAGAQVTSVKAVEVSVSPSSQSGAQGERLTYIVTVTNIGNTWDNYRLSKTDELGWLVTENFAWMPLAPGDFASVSFDVIIPKNAGMGTRDNVTVTATSTTEPAVSDNASCIAHVWKTNLSLENLYAVTLEFEGYFPEGENLSALVAKFYTYGGGSYQDQTIVCSENIPGHVTLLKNISRPGNGPIQRIKLVVVDNAGNELRTVKIFETTRPILIARMGQINGLWPFANDAQRTIYVSELGSINGLWPFSPETFNDP